MGPCSFACASCDLGMHWPEIGIRKRLANDGLNAILAERAHERVRDGDLPQPIDSRSLIDHAPPDQHREPPALTAVLGELGAGDGAPCRDQFALLDAGHAAAPRSLALAKAMIRDRT